MSKNTSLYIGGMNFRNGSFWMNYEYEEKNYPLFFVELPNLSNRHIVCLLKVFDELYGDTNQETTEWALEYQLLARLLITQGQLLVNPLHLDLSDEDAIQAVLDEMAATDRDIYLSARTISQEEIRAAFEQRVR